MTAAAVTVVRVTEHDPRLLEVGYDVDLRPGVDPDDAEDHLDRASDEVDRRTLQVNVEIVSTEVIAP